MKTEGEDRLLTKSKNFDKFERKRVKIQKLKIPAYRGPAGFLDKHPCQISFSYDKSYDKN